MDRRSHSRRTQFLYRLVKFRSRDRHCFGVSLLSALSQASTIPSNVCWGRIGDALERRFCWTTLEHGAEILHALYDLGKGKASERGVNHQGLPEGSAIEPKPAMGPPLENPGASVTLVWEKWFRPNPTGYATKWKRCF